jgi:hypothetical protein
MTGKKDDFDFNFLNTSFLELFGKQSSCTMGNVVHTLGVHSRKLSEVYLEIAKGDVNFE